MKLKLSILTFLIAGAYATYSNGIQIDSDTGSIYALNTGLDFTIGSDGTNYFGGDMDNVRVWNTYELGLLLLLLNFK